MMLLGLTLSLISPDAFADAILKVNRENEKRVVIPEQSKMLDHNGDPAALIEIRSQLDGLKFSNNVIKVDSEKGYDANIYYVYVIDGTKKLQVNHDNYLNVEIDFPDPVRGDEMLTDIIVIGDMFDTDTVMILSETDTYPVNVRYDDFATLYIDNQQVENTDTVYLEEGLHSFTTKHGKYSYSTDVNVKRRNYNNVDPRVSGKVIVKGLDYKATEKTFIPYGDAPTPNAMSDNGKSYKFDHMLGDYKLHATASTHAWVEKNITVTPRSHNIFRLDEMVGYLLVMYHGTNLQPLGLSVGYCKDFGGFISWSTDIRTSIKTPYGRVEFKDKNGEDDFRTTAMTFSAGPMFKVVRKLYVQLGGGTVRYLSTGDKKILTSDYKYKWGGSACATLFYRYNNIIFGAGYTHQFVKNPFNTGWRNQVNFSIGWAKGQN